MKFSLDTNNKTRAIEAYGKGYFKINGQISKNNIIIFGHKTETFEHEKTDDLLSDQLISQILLEKPDILIIGTGEKQLFPSKQLKGLLMNQKISLEVMNTGAACRTYNVLLTEDRNCIAVLYLT